MTCLLYCRMTGTRLIIDHHSIWRVKTLGRGPLSKVIGLLEEVVSRAAYANTAPHTIWAEKLEEMGAQRVEVVHDFVERNPRARDDALRARLATQAVIAISSHGGHPLERMESEAAAVGAVPDVALLITGPKEKLTGRLSPSSLPPNVRYLGFMPREEYEKLKASADFALNITDEPYTLSHVILEFMASSLPVISSKQQVVEDLFGESLLYTDSSSPADVTRAVLSFRSPALRDEYRRRITARYEELMATRQEEVTRLRSLFTQAST
jgi:glycosyltransferase involved in cell wall biosynthesis